LENTFEKEKEKKRDSSNKVKNNLKLERNKEGLPKSSIKNKFILKEDDSSKKKAKIEIEENRGNDTYYLKRENPIDWCGSTRKWLEKKFKKLINIGKQKNNFSRIACPPKQKNSSSNVDQNEKINVNWTKDKVINFLKTKFQINQEILSKIDNEEIDGQSFVLLRDEDFKTLGITPLKKNKILPYVDNDILRLSNNIKQDPIYLKVEKENKDNLWNSLEEKLKELKLGEALKYIKYLIIKDMPPKKEEKEDLYIYFKKIFDLKENFLIEMKEDFEVLLNLGEKDFHEQCENWNLEGYDEFKLKIIIEIIRQKDEKNEDNKEEEINEEKIKEKNEINENIQREENSTSSNLIENSIEDEDEYLFYCVIEVFEYQTSQRDITLGLKNPKDEYQRICMDFNIKYEEETSYLDYNKANEYQLSTFMLWGSKESLFSFLKFHKIKIAIDSLESKNNEKSGIYLCLNKTKKIAYLIIWPGKKSYEYSKIDEPNDSILLTLIRYGFYLSRNSILCLSNNEIEEFNYNGYEIFQDPESSAFLTERSQVVINENLNKVFKIGEANHFIEGLKDVLKDKKIIDAKINQNCILLFEELKDAIKSTKIEKKNFEEFIIYESKFDIYFEESFNIKDIPINKFYLLIRQCPCYLKNKNNSKCYSEEQLQDIFEEKLNKEIDKLFIKIYSELLDDNYLNRKYICQYCKNNKNTNELYYNKEKKYFHKSCYLSNNKNKAQFNYKELDEDAKEIEKYELYLICKNNLLKKIGNKKSKKNELIINLFLNSEKKFEKIEYKNALMIDKNILFEEIQNFKNLIFDYNYNNKEGNKKLSYCS